MPESPRGRPSFHLSPGLAFDGGGLIGDERRPLPHLGGSNPHRGPLGRLFAEGGPAFIKREVVVGRSLGEAHGFEPKGPSGPELANKVILVTGATGGIGFQTASMLAARGATLLVTGRDPEHGAAAVHHMRQSAGHDRVDFLRVDHSTIAGNEELATAVSRRVDRLDILVNNVGGIYPTRTLTADGIEMTLAINFLAPFVLTQDLLPLLSAPHGEGRCLNVVSSSYKMSKGDPFQDLQSETGYVGIFVHGRAKLLTLIWTMALGRSGIENGLVATAVNPGMAWTPMTRSLTPETVPAWRYIFPIVQFFQRRADPSHAARYCEELALAEADTVAGKYFDKAREVVIDKRLTDPELLKRVVSVGNKLRNPIGRQAPTP